METVLRGAIEAALKELELGENEFTVEHPTDFSHGDYATNVALVAAKAAGLNPRELAEQLVEKLNGQIEGVEKIEVAGPGFINFYLSRQFFVDKLANVNELKDKWGSHDDWAGKTVIVEYTDPNPFKEFHIGHLFTNAVGESLARLFMVAGAVTKRVNYQGDVGMHVANAIWGMQQLGLTADSDFTARELGQAYAKGATAYKEDSEAAAAMRAINKAIYERSDEAVLALYDCGRQVSLDYFEELYELLGTKFDEYFFESEAGPIGKQLVLDNPEIFPESDGARVYRGEAEGLHTRVFLNNEGLPTYEAKELALAKLKEDRVGNYDHSIISTANEINEYFKVLLAALAKVYPDLAAKTEHIGHGTVRLKSGKMSSRTGQVISARDFIEEIAAVAKDRIAVSNPSLAEDSALATDVAIAAIKYTTLRGNIRQDSVFDKEQALSFEGDSGPYLQYTHARISSVLQKAKDNGIVADSQNPPAEPYAVERLLYRWPEVTKVALRERAPHHVTGYLTDLASAFNTFYATEPIADSSDPSAPYKVALTDAVRQTLKNGLWVLGIEAPEQM